MHANTSSLPRRSLFAEFYPHETFMLFFAAFLVLVGTIFQVREWPLVILRAVAIAAVIFGMNYWSSRKPGRRETALKLFYVSPLVPVFFKTAELISFPLYGHDFDSVLIAADRLLFGVNPTQWIYQHLPHWPVLTEYLMVCYSLFYFLPVAVAAELYRRAKREPNTQIATEDMERMHQVFFIIIYGFLLSYASYFILPSIGPRFTLHDFFTLDQELPGVFLTKPIRAILNRGENMWPGMPMSEILRHVTRDAFPSGHGDITLLSMVLAFQFRVKSRWVIAIVGTSLFIATIYLRYHYVIDLIGGFVLAAITLYTWRWVRDGMNSLQDRILSARE